MTAKEALECARDLVTDKYRWCQYTYAVDKAGQNVSPDNPKAVRWCALGALIRCTSLTGPNAAPAPKRARAFREAKQALVDTATPIHPTHVNDTLGHAAVMQLYRDAIALIEREGHASSH